MARSKKAARRAVKREEEKVAKTLGGRRTFLSGAGNEKGDGVVPHTYQIEDGIPIEQEEWAFRIENKMTEKTGYRLKGNDWAKHLAAARRAGETPLFVVRLGTYLRRKALRLCVLPCLEANRLLSVRIDVLQCGKSYKISEREWNHAVDTTEAYINGDKGLVPHIRFNITGQRAGRPAEEYDLVVMDFEWFKHLTGVGE